MFGRSCQKSRFALARADLRTRGGEGVSRARQKSLKTVPYHGDIEFRHTHTAGMRVVRVARLYKRACIRTGDHETKPTRQAVNPWQRRHYIHITHVVPPRPCAWTTLATRAFIAIMLADRRRSLRRGGPRQFSASISRIVRQTEYIIPGVINAPAG